MRMETVEVTRENVWPRSWKMLACNISQLIRVRKKLSEPAEMERQRLNQNQLF
jgi:hypothetical protein